MDFIVQMANAQMAAWGISGSLVCRKVSCMEFHMHTSTHSVHPTSNMQSKDVSGGAAAKAEGVKTSKYID